MSPEPSAEKQAPRDSVNIRIPRDLWEQVKAIAERDERTVQTTTARLIRKGLEHD